MSTTSEGEDMTQTHDDDLPEPPLYESTAQRTVLLAVLLIGAFVLILNQSLLNTALPALMGYFDITAAEAQWVTTLFMLVNGIIIPMTGWLIGRFTTRQLFITAMVLFAVGTLIAALSPTYWILLLARVLQASASGLVMPLMQTILFSIFPPDQRGQAMGWFGLIIGVAPAIGPSLSGFIIDRWPWQYLFWLMLPIALLALVVSWAMLRNVTQQTHASLDVLSVVLSTLGFGGLLFGFSMTGATGWASPEVIVSLAVGVVALVWFVRRQLSLEEPLLELRVLTRPMFTLNTALIMLMFAAFMGALVVLPVIMQTGLGFSAMTSGLAMLPGALLMGLVSPLAGKIYDKVGARGLSVAGFALILVTGILFTRVTPETSYLYMATVNAVRQIGAGLIMTPVTTAALNALPQRLVPHGTAVNNTFRQMAASIGTAIVVTVMTAQTLDPAEHGPEGAIRGAVAAFHAANVFTVIGLVGAFFVREKGEANREPDERAR